MATATVQVNGKSYIIGCADGEERRLQELARAFDHTVQQLADNVGGVGDLRLVIMAALMQADELSDARAQLARQQEETRLAREAASKGDARAAAALDAAARRVEELSQKLSG